MEGISEKIRKIYIKKEWKKESAQGVENGRLLREKRNAQYALQKMRKSTD